MIAALFVDPTGPYADMADVDSWDEQRDARLYPGPHPVVAHPPCERWGQYATSGPNPRAARRAVGDDGRCFASALFSVRTYGGVLEHPRGSKAFAHFGVASPPSVGGWIRTECGGHVCCVAQGHYGHPAQKFTWLYAYRVVPPDLIWGPCPGRKRLDSGYHSLEEARAARARADHVPEQRLSKDERVHTPRAFAELLVKIANTVR